jgi:SAM-dependent methyltransferase
VKRCVRCRRTFAGPSWTCPHCGFAPDAHGAIRSFCAPAEREGFDPAAFAHLAELEQGSFWFRARNRLIAWAVSRYFPAARSLLEVGCGTGFVLAGLRRALPQLQLVGGELHLQGLEHAAARLPGVDLLHLDARRLPFAEEFDVVGAFDVLEHIDDDRGALAEMRAAVRPGGGLVVTVPQHPWLWSAVDDYGEHQRRYRRAELAAKVAAAGFELRRLTSFVTALLPAMAAVRLWGRLRPTPPDPAAELATPRSLNRALERVMDLERAAIARGVDLPAGGSLLAVAVRT